MEIIIITMREPSFNLLQSFLKFSGGAYYYYYVLQVTL